MTDETKTQSLLIDVTSLSQGDLDALLSGAPIRVVGHTDTAIGKVAEIEVLPDDDYEGREEPDHDLSLEYPDEDLFDGGWSDSYDY